MQRRTQPRLRPSNAELCSAGQPRAAVPTWFGAIAVASGRGLWGVFRGLRRDQSRDIMFVAAMRSNGYIPLLQTCWIEGRACPRRYLSVLPSHVRANLFGSD